MDKTTIQIRVNTLERLKAIKRYERESYDELLNNLIDETGDDDLTGEEIEDIKEALDEVKRGETISLEDVARELGISLK